MSTTGRREFLKKTGASLIGAAALGAPPELLSAGEDEPASPGKAPLPPHRPLHLEGVHGYADRESVRAGEAISFLVSSTEPYRLSICRLGLDVDDPAGDRVLQEFPETPARPQAIHPGSYLHVEAGLGEKDPIRALTLECWTRPWRLTAGSGVITQHDPPRDCGYGLLLEANGRISFHLGDGGGLRPELVHSTGPGAVKVGAWHHVAATWDGGEKAVWIDGREAGRWAFAGPMAAGGKAPLRIGARAEDGLAAGFLDGDIALPVLRGRALDPMEIAERHRERALQAPKGDAVLGFWPLDEERGGRARDGSPHARHARIVNHATWMIGGPSFDPDVPRFGGYDPRRDPRRGHGIRLASDDLYDCGWQATHTYSVPEEAPAGMYVARIRYSMGGRPFTYSITFLVRRSRETSTVRPPVQGSRERPRPPILILASTNTWRAYNATPFAAPRPGIRHIAGTDGMPNGRGDPPAFSFYRRHAGGQGTYQVGLRVPWPVAGPYIRYGDATDYSHLARADRFVQVWLEKSGYEFDIATDLDFHREPDLPLGHKVLIVNGHSEYWSREMYEGARRYLDGGGNLIVLSGNSLFWRVSFDEEGTVLECRKVDAPGDQVPPERRGECWHSHDGLRGGLMNECGLPGWKLIGLTTIGWNNHGDPKHFSPFIVEAPDHFLFREPVPVRVSKGDPIGEAPGGGLPRANGHEVDARPSTLRRLLEKPIPDGASHPEDPPGITLLAAGRGWPRDAATFDYFLRPVKPSIPLGGEVIYWERPTGGRVFNAGSIGAGWALLADPRLQDLVANALHHFGVPRP